MITYIGKFKCQILRDAMRVVAQFNNTARMRVDETGIHIGAVNSLNTSVVWVDIPAESFEAQWDPKDPAVTKEIGIPCEKLCRMLYAYEEPQEVWFSLEYRIGIGHFLVTSGDEGTLRTYQTSLNDIKKIPDMDAIKTADSLQISCDKDAPILRDRLRPMQDDGDPVLFRYVKTRGKFTVEIVSGASPNLDHIVMDHPISGKDAPKVLITTISSKLLQEAIAPECIDGTIQILFGGDSLIFMGTKVNGCAVTMAIAPRIET